MMERHHFGTRSPFKIDLFCRFFKTRTDAQTHTQTDGHPGTWRPEAMDRYFAPQKNAVSFAFRIQKRTFFCALPSWVSAYPKSTLKMADQMVFWVPKRAIFRENVLSV
jgi:hypothetical protein